MTDTPFALPADDTALDPVTIVLQGPPFGKERPRIVSRGRFAPAYTPEKTVAYEARVADLAKKAMGNRAPMEGPVTVTMRAVFAIPPSWSPRQQQKAMTKEISPTKKPDIDNLAKIVFDPMNGIVYRDDAQIVQATLRKEYGPQPLVAICVRPL